MAFEWHSAKAESNLKIMAFLLMKLLLFLMTLLQSFCRICGIRQMRIAIFVWALPPLAVCWPSHLQSAEIMFALSPREK